MQLCKVQLETSEVRVGVVEDDHIRFLDLVDYVGLQSLTDVLHSDDPAAVARDLIDDEAPTLSVHGVTFLAPLDRQEVWAAGVTYKRSQEARERESEGAAAFYDKVYDADRPELFFKATPNRTVGHGGRVRIRKDSKWSVPEPEFGLVLDRKLQLVGYTIGNDMSARDIEGENPLYLPQAKMYANCCAVGPVITLRNSMPKLETVKIRMSIDRFGQTVFQGGTTLAEMNRSLEDLISWLGRDNTFPHGVILLTGTGIVPPDDFTLEADDRVSIAVDGIGRLSNIVEQAE